MPAIVSAASHRLGTITNSATGAAEPATAPHSPATALETVQQHLPTEFGELTHLFGGEPAPSAQYEPMNPALQIPGGSRPGALGGLAPDFRSVAARPVAAVKDFGESARKAAPLDVPAISAAARNYVSRARAFLKI